MADQQDVHASGAPQSDGKKGGRWDNLVSGGTKTCEASAWRPSSASRAGQDTVTQFDTARGLHYVHCTFKVLLLALCLKPPRFFMLLPSFQEALS